MKTLHVGNIAQNAYRNAKLLNAVGVESHVAHFDFFHFACCPEWDEALGEGMSISDLGDPYFPDFVSWDGTWDKCPSWVGIGPQFLVTNYLDHLARESEHAYLSWCTLQFQRIKAAHFKTNSPQMEIMPREVFEAAVINRDRPRRFKEAMETAYKADQLLARVRAGVARTYDETVAKNYAPPLVPVKADNFLHDDPEGLAELRAFREAGLSRATGLEFDSSELPAYDPPAEVAEADAAVFAVAAPWWKRVFEQYDAVYLYGSTPPLGYLSQVPYFAYEHGTIRKKPFEDNVVGRLLARAYEAADRVYITNMDYLCAEKRLTFAPEQRIYMPHGFDERKAFGFMGPKPDHSDGIVKFFSPSRHVWCDENETEYKQNNFIIEACAILQARGITNFEVTFIDWGVDAPKSRELIEELGVGDRIKWTPPMPPRDLWSCYTGSHAVLDQFFIPAIGGISVETLTLGRPLITYSEPAVNQEFWGEDMPSLSANSAEGVADHMASIIADPDDEAGLGQAARDFMLRRHSGARIIELLLQPIRERLFETPGKPVDNAA